MSDQEEGQWRRSYTMLLLWNALVVIVFVWITWLFNWS